MAKPSGTPKSLIVTWLAVGTRTLRASRSAHERREWARCARERITSALGGEAAAGGGMLTSIRWCRTSCIQARRCSLRLQSRQSSGAGPTWRGWSNTLTCLGFFVALPSHWHWWRNGQERQLRMLAAYTTRRLPSASLRCSCATSEWPAGQCTVPSGWRAKSCPEKRPAFQGRARDLLAIALHRRLLRCDLCDRGSKLGRAHRR